MSRSQDLANQIDDLVHELQRELATPTSDFVAIDTVDALTKACADGGKYKLAAGSYTGNFVAAKPLTLLALEAATLAPGDPLLPTLKVKAPATFDGLHVVNGAPDRECIVVGEFGATSAQAQPDGVTFRKCLVAAGPNGGHRGIALHGMNLSVLDCQVTGFWEKGRDSQAIWIHNGPGPYLVENCYLEASGENIMAGGDDVLIANCVPSDVTLRGNTCFKPDAWRTNGSLVKNSIELKNARRVLIENNVCDGNWKGGQAGVPIVLTVRNQNGKTPWALVDDVVVRGNRTQRCVDAAAVSILGWDNNPGGSQQSQTMLIEHNLFSDSPIGIIVGNGVARALGIRNNTMPVVKNAFLQFYDTRVDAASDQTLAVRSPITFVENVAKAGQYGITGTNLAVGTPALLGYATVVDWRGNVIEKSVERPGLAFPNPSANFLVDAGAFATILEPAPSFKMKSGQPFGNAGY